MDINKNIIEHRFAEKELREKTKFLQLLQVVTRAANEAESVNEAMQTALDEICAQTKWPVGHLYLLDRSSGQLEPTEIWYLVDPDRFQNIRNVTESTRFASAVGLANRVLASGKPAWITDVTADRDVAQAVEACDVGVKMGCAFPLLVRREVLGVLEFFSADAEEADESLLDLMTQIGPQLGRVIERLHAEHALKESEQRFRELAERVRVLPWEADPKTFQFTYVGPQCAEILGHPQKLWYEKDFWVRYMHPEDRLWALDYCSDCAATQDHYEFEYRMVNSEGEQVWFQDIVNVVRNASGPTLLRGFMIDITERKRDETKRAAVMRRFARLTQREREVMALVVAGYSNKKSAVKLKSSPRTVDVHRARVMEKMNARSLPELVAMAITCDVY